MPVIITFDLEGAKSIERNRIQCTFERFGWENLGGSSYRYPKLGSNEPVEDWFNHVIPALMLFRSYVVDSERILSRFTLDVQSSTGANLGNKYGNTPEKADKVKLFKPTHSTHFREENLRNWLLSVKSPIESKA